MENASKALIIAGAILLSILIIGLGMMVFNNAKNALDDASLDREKISTFNSTFENYVGENVRGTNVRTLCSSVQSSNATEEEENQIKITYGSNFKEVTSQSEIMSLRSAIKTGKVYKVELKYSTVTKLVNEVIINDVQ